MQSSHFVLEGLVIILRDHQGNDNEAMEGESSTCVVKVKDSNTHLDVEVEVGCASVQWKTCGSSGPAWTPGFSPLYPSRKLTLSRLIG